MDTTDHRGHSDRLGGAMSPQASRNWALVNGVAALLGACTFAVTADVSVLAGAVLNVIGMEFFYWVSREGGLDVD